MDSKFVLDLLKKEGAEKDIFIVRGSTNMLFQNCKGNTFAFFSLSRKLLKGMKHIRICSVFLNINAKLVYINAK